MDGSTSYVAGQSNIDDHRAPMNMRMRTMDLKTWKPLRNRVLRVQIATREQAVLAPQLKVLARSPKAQWLG